MSPRAAGALAAIAALAIDQAHKLWTIATFGAAPGFKRQLTPFMDLVMAWNPGISYSLLRADTLAGRLALIALAAAATFFLCLWLWRTTTLATALGLGLVIGGALGNVIDRVAYGAVADFFHFHVGTFSWYVFNLADCAIVAGVVLLLFDTAVMRPEIAAKSV